MFFFQHFCFHYFSRKPFDCFLFFLGSGEGWGGAEHDHWEKKTMDAICTFQVWVFQIVTLPKIMFPFEIKYSLFGIFKHVMDLSHPFHF